MAKEEYLIQVRNPARRGPALRPSPLFPPFLAAQESLIANRNYQSSVTKEFLRAKFDCTHALAWTIVPDDQEKPDTLQLCPWFLDYAMKQNAQFQGQFEAGKIGTMIKNLKLDRLAAWILYTPVDLFQLFDKVLVHEVRIQPVGTSAMHN